MKHFFSIKILIMKRFLSLSLFMSIFGTMLFIQSCSFDKCHEIVKYKVYNAVYMTKAQLRNISVKEASPLRNPGKIYVYNHYLLINELYEGVHIFDNSDKNNPVNLSFISIPGNVDIAVKDNVLYADNYIDLLSFDISNPANPVYLDAIKDVFKENRYEYNNRGYRVYYKASNIIEEVQCEDAVNDVLFRGDVVLFNEGSYSGEKDSNSSGSAQNLAIGGSMARFTIMNNRLYVVDNSKLHIFNVEVAKQIKNTGDVIVGWGIETIFPVKNKLFIGSNSGMYIFEAQNPDNPYLLSTFRHASACDPVFVSGDNAYITLRSGTKCQGYTNQLDVVNIKDLLSPRFIKTYPMDNPHGLTIVDNTMVLCEGDFGIKVLDVRNPEKIKVKSKITDKHFYDVIGISTKDIIMVGNDGLYQYKLNGYDLEQISVINVEK